MLDVLGFLLNSFQICCLNSDFKMHDCLPLFVLVNAISSPLCWIICRIPHSVEAFICKVHCKTVQDIMLGEATKPTTSPAATRTASPSVNGGGDAGDFECNICLDLAQDPIITLCGHLFCWPCLYRWLHLHSQSHECPVCKALIQEDKLIPLYGRGKKESDPRSKPVPGVEIPNRPSGQRPPTAPPPPPPQYEANGFSNLGFNFVGGLLPVVSAGIGNFAMLAAFGGLLPSMFSIQISNGFPMHRVNPGYGYGHFGGQERGDNNLGPQGTGTRGEVDTEDNKLISMFLIVLGLVVLCLLV